jgi:hypothetical protein
VLRSIALIACLGVLGCAGDDDDFTDAGDLSLGDVSAADMKADGQWGAALTCKPVPDLPALPHPEIVVSLDGLTLHLFDRTTGFDKVFPVGVGAIDTASTSLTWRESHSYYPIAAYNKNDFVIKPSTIQPCKTWWTDPATGERLPVFAGLPFMSWSGSYAIHGPIDNFRAPNGGNLRRGYVSHGCIRMEAADVLEVYARIKGVASIPVHVQRAPERDPEGERVDVPSKWVGAECTADSECAYTNGFCKQNAYSGRGVCSAHCTSTCADRAGQPATFCVADADVPGTGMCVPKQNAVDFECRPYDHLVAATRARNNQPSVTASVCIPGSPGWVGDRCRASTDCTDGTTCHEGVCTIACERYCDDQPGYADTFCVSDPALGSGGNCARTCTPSSNGSECSEDSACVARGRNGQPSTVKNVCIPE